MCPSTATGSDEPPSFESWGACVVVTARCMSTPASSNGASACAACARSAACSWHIALELSITQSMSSWVKGAGAGVEAGPQVNSTRP